MCPRRYVLLYHQGARLGIGRCRAQIKPQPDQETHQEDREAAKSGAPWGVVAKQRELVGRLGPEDRLIVDPPGAPIQVDPDQVGRGGQDGRANAQ